MAGRFQVAGCAIIEKEGKALVTRRSEGRWTGGTWEFVSGRIEQGEDFEQGLKREVKEEVSLEIELVSPLCVDHFYRGVEKTPENEVMMITYLCKWVSGEVKIKVDEQDKYEWVFLKDINLDNYPGFVQYFGKEIEAYLNYEIEKEV